MTYAIAIPAPEAAGANAAVMAAMSIKARQMRYVFLLLFFLASLMDCTVTAQETVQGDIKIMRSWVHETAERQAVFHPTIANTGAKADRLLRVATPVASKVTISDSATRRDQPLERSRTR